ncbi:MAG: hypothetical protein OEV00_03695 [Acidobacteriota bacterium]|nr:hypothetical protein [Acidobacteriota bacterium]MDH3784414.1 hypothetical protein [Acidobacteriota bacterium]
MLRARGIWITICLLIASPLAAVETLDPVSLGLALEEGVHAERVVLPAGMVTLNCEDRMILVTDGALGSCVSRDGDGATCENPETRDLAQASCEHGCERSDGRGLCVVIPKPKKTSPPNDDEDDPEGDVPEADVPEIP